MLIDPLPKCDLATGEPSGAFRLLDLSPGRTVRKADSALIGVVGAHTATLTISHSASKENGAVPTDRSAVRLQVQKTTAEGKSVIAHATLVLAYPSSNFTVAEMVAIWQTLVLQLSMGNDGVFPSGTLTYAELPLAIERIILGEP